MSTISRRGRLPLTLRSASTGGWPLKTRRGGFAGLAVGLAIALTDRLDLWQRRLRDRDMLRAMSTAQLKDIGLSRADALNESEKPFWRA